MKLCLHRRLSRSLLRVLVALCIGLALQLPAQQQRERSFAKLSGAARVVAIADEHGGWGLAIRDAGAASAEAAQPVQITLSALPEKKLSAAYRQIDMRDDSLEGVASVQAGAASIEVRDRWTAADGVLHLQRAVQVHGAAAGAPAGFDSGIAFRQLQPAERTSYDVFVPGMIYGSTAHLTASAVGGSETYASGAGAVQIREDRMPAPLYAVRFADGSSLAVLDPHPDGGTTVADAHDTEVVPLTDSRFHFGAVGAEAPRDGRPAEGFWYPGSEGEVTYRGNTYPGGQLHRWRLRYTPLEDGATQSYRVDIRVTQTESFPALQRDTWRWAYSTLAPMPRHQQIGVMERGITNVLLSQAIMRDGRTGLPNSTDAVDPAGHPDDKAILGFTGKNLEAAEFLLAEADREPNAERAKEYRDTGNAIFETFLRLKMTPPVGEGYKFATGAPALAIEREHCVFLRSFGDDMKSTMRAYLREKRAGRVHDDWLRWVRGFTDWLLTYQRADGSFPRSWRRGTGEVADRSPQSSYNPIPLLLLMAEATSDEHYREAAVRAGEFAWKSGQQHGQFVGGTIDNPDILDKEAGTLSLEAYLALYEATKDRRWIPRAQAAADYAESYIYLWNVPMAVGEDEATVAWKPQASTVGTQLIATGHSLTDDYMSFDVDSYARLWKLTGDRHYRDVARLLLHGTKEMVSSPEHPYDLRGTGWQQEHWSFAPKRGYGLHRLWLPWVATSQLKGIILLREYDSALFRELVEEGSR